MDLRRVEELRQVLQRSRDLCNRLIDSGETSFSAANPPDLVVQLVTDDDGFHALMNHQRTGVRTSAETVRNLARKLRTSWACLPNELQHVILSQVVTYQEPILGYGALYLSPRCLPWAKALRRERLNHLAINKACRSFRAYTRFYVENNTFAFLDAAGLTFFLRRVGFEQHQHVKSIMALAPTLASSWSTWHMKPTLMSP